MYKRLNLIILSVSAVICSLMLTSCVKPVYDMAVLRTIGWERIVVNTEPEGADMKVVPNISMYATLGNPTDSKANKKKVSTTPAEIYVYMSYVNKHKGQPLFTLEKDGYKTYQYIYTGMIPPSNELNIRLTPISSSEASEQQVSRDNPGKTDMERSIIRWNIDSDPRGARLYWRVISSVPNEVKNTNETYLGTTPYEETRGFNIVGLTYANSNDVTIEIKVTKRGYEDQVKRFNARMALDQQEISGFFELVEK